MESVRMTSRMAGEIEACRRIVLQSCVNTTAQAVEERDRRQISQEEDEVQKRHEQRPLSSCQHPPPPSLGSPFQTYPLSSSSDLDAGFACHREVSEIERRREPPCALSERHANHQRGAETAGESCLSGEEGDRSERGHDRMREEKRNDDDRETKKSGGESLPMRNTYENGVVDQLRDRLYRTTEANRLLR
ncbi:hypothetical protein CSUI_004779, partial [Cystoisospora suis]